MKILNKIIFLISCIILFSCNDNDSIIDSEPFVGKISGKVVHHESFVPNAVVFIKFGATEFPGIDSDNYDDQVVMSDQEANYEFVGLQKGDYYLFSRGFDDECGCDVIGGIPISLDSNSAIIETDIPVTE